MAWQTTLVSLVRVLINDISGSDETFSDERIQDAIAVGALLAINEYTFDTEYVIDVDTPDISPDPTVTATYDALAMALFSLKAACILNLGQLRTDLPSIGIRVRDGDSEVDTTGLTLKGYDTILSTGSCGSYDKLIADSYIKNNSGRGKAIYGPYGDGSLPPFNNEIGLQNGRLFFDYWFR